MISEHVQQVYIEQSHVLDIVEYGNLQSGTIRPVVLVDLVWNNIDSIATTPSFPDINDGTIGYDGVTQIYKNRLLQPISGTMNLKLAVNPTDMSFIVFNTNYNDTSTTTLNIALNENQPTGYTPVILDNNKTYTT